jgi:hypothetical protein
LRDLSRLSLSADAIAIPFRVFTDADTAIGKLLQYGKDGVTEFLKGGFSKFSGGLPTIDGLKDFADRFRKVSEVADVLFKPENTTLVSALSEDAVAQQGIIDVVTNYVNGLCKQP